MNNKRAILTGIKNLKMQIKRIKTEVQTLEGMVGEMENSLDSEDNNVTCTDEPILPKSLDFQEMKDLLDKLAEAGILKASYALKNQSWTERSVIVAFLSGKVQRKCMWKPFADLWHCDKGAMESAYQKHFDTKAAKLYYKKLERSVG